MRKRALALCLPALIATVGCSQAKDSPREGAAATADMPQHQPAVARRSSADPDTSFLQAMIPHHQGAIDMARDEIAKGSDPRVLAIAQKVIEDQQVEIAQMEKWLADRRAQPPEAK